MARQWAQLNSGLLIPWSAVEQIRQPEEPERLPLGFQACTARAAEGKATGGMAPTIGFLAALRR